MRKSSVPVPLICKSSSSFLVVLRVRQQLLLQLLLLALVIIIPTAFALKAEWIPIPTSQKISPRRSGHTAFSTSTAAVGEDNNKGSAIYVFGGYIEEDNGSNKKEGGPPSFHREVRNDLWKFDFHNQNHNHNIYGSWKKQETTGQNLPGPRLATASAVDAEGKFAYVFGGWDPQTPGTGGIILEEIHKLNLQTMEWTYVTTKLPDGPTSRHVAVTLFSGSDSDNNKILIHNHRCMDHVWIFDPTTEQFTKQKTTGTNPGSLGLHTATLLNQSTVLVFGGATKNGHMSNQSYVLDMKTWNWNQVDLLDESCCPSPRAGACLCTYNNNIACLFGGAETSTETGLNPKGDVWALHLFEEEGGRKKGRWEMLLDDKKEEDTTMPEPRNAATLTKIATTLDSKDEGGESSSTKFLLTGGWAPFRRTWDDVFVLSIEGS